MHIAVIGATGRLGREALRAARDRGFLVGYMRAVYCYHIGVKSVLTPERDYGGPFIPVVSWDTLEPVDAEHVNYRPVPNG